MKNSPKIQKKHSTIPGTGKELLASSDVSRRERIAKKSKATQRPRYVHFVCILVQSIGAPPTRQNKRHGTQGRRVATKYLEHPVKNSCWPLAIPDGHDATGVSFFNGWEIEWSAVLRRLTRVWVQRVPLQSLLHKSGLERFSSGRAPGFVGLVCSYTIGLDVFFTGTRPRNWSNEPDLVR